jgi:hypothetical protein
LRKKKKANEFEKNPFNDYYYFFFVREKEKEKLIFFLF